MALITGNTYPVKDQIKALGGKWNADAKGWEVPDAKAEQAKALVASAPKDTKGTKSSWAEEMLCLRGSTKIHRAISQRADLQIGRMPRLF